MRWLFQHHCFTPLTFPPASGFLCPGFLSTGSSTFASIFLKRGGRRRWCGSTWSAGKQRVWPLSLIRDLESFQAKPAGGWREKWKHAKSWNPSNGSHSCSPWEAVNALLTSCRKMTLSLCCFYIMHLLCLHCCIYFIMYLLSFIVLFYYVSCALTVRQP